MKNRVIIKAVELFFIYMLALVGMFVWQFWRGSGLSLDVGALHLALATAEDEAGAVALKNDVSLSFLGVTFAASDASPAVAVADDGARTALVLADWAQDDDYSARLAFADGSSLLFGVSDGTQDATLSVTATLAQGVSAIELPYRLAKAYATEDAADGRLILSNRDKKFAFLAPQFSDGRVVFTGRDRVATYARYQPRVFAFSALEGAALTDDKSYTANVTAFRDELLAKASQALRSAPASLSERDIVAYLAEMSFRGRIDAALSAVPASFRNGSSRTYLSTPYFGNLVAMSASLASRTAGYTADVRQALSSPNLAVFTEDGIADYILRERKTDDIRSLLRLPATMRPFAPTLQEAAAILSVYTPAT